MTLGEALGLAEAGRVDEAIRIALAELDRAETPQARYVFTRCIESARLTRVPSRVRALVVRALREAWIRPEDLARGAVSLLRGSPPIDRTDPLLLALLETSPVPDAKLERFLTQARRELLEAAVRDDDSVVTDFEAALAHVCLRNDFVFDALDDELSVVARLRSDLEAALGSGRPVGERRLLAAACYFPLVGLTHSAALLDPAWSARLEDVLRVHVREPIEERGLRARMPRLTDIADGVSEAVRAQYEESPYPRWSSLEPAGAPVALDTYLRQRVAGLPREPIEGTQLLVAGCGTGREPIGLARQVAGSQVLAVDLSLASLGYAQRKAVELGADNVEFAQADIVRLGSIGRTFGYISSSGVLHHLADPAEGLRNLVPLLRPGGYMMLGLYSELGRRAVVAARRHIAERGYAPTADGIRRCRRDILAADAGELAQVMSFDDFFVGSECRDLLFHVQEHRFTVSKIAALLESAGLAFAGFSVPPSTRQLYARQFPEDPHGLVLGNWQSFEEAHPQTFAGMYFFLARKP
ncbi:Ubiquinone biosynthesis O-methyltransferase, mitochondrial [Usitatibacter rugosus]|uniref:Ubiquinone biosynthesis O-methyltransferase, mitochondrial n=1 Tax=Usitatibacter rugosus TaxID=2732067 RepID=A0A6M4GSB8_9PROT|nr:class I SAM-dependent methyltransferase [Usitatibacter rugosus]QJR10199.1 Ubiquinone biosynthesis O-methyltransferase, mitochondrial [Usitatibacter rugosus]